MKPLNDLLSRVLFSLSYYSPFHKTLKYLYDTFIYMKRTRTLDAKSIRIEYKFGRSLFLAVNFKATTILHGKYYVMFYQSHCMFILDSSQPVKSCNLPIWFDELGWRWSHIILTDNCHDKKQGCNQGGGGFELPPPLTKGRK